MEKTYELHITFAYGGHGWHDEKLLIEDIIRRFECKERPKITSEFLEKVRDSLSKNYSNVKIICWQWLDN